MGLCLAACSPKVQPIKKETPPVVVEKVEEKKAPKKFTEADIALLVPFNLNDFRNKTLNKKEIEKHALAIDFYQGFMLGIDSSSRSGLNFKVQVFDTQDNNQQIDRLLIVDRLKESNLVVGPVFPEGLKYITDYAVANKLPVVSPLAASKPDEFKNPYLISIVNNIGLHAAKIGGHILKKYQPQETVAVLISTKSPSDEVLAQPLREYFLSHQDRKMPFQEYASVFTLEMKLDKSKKYVVMLSSSDHKFVSATIDKLIKMKSAGLDVDLYGHPDWLKQTYVTEKLQAMNTVVSTSYQIDFKSPEVVAFVKKYRKRYNFEPGEYAFKGFDIGLYFGLELSRHGADFLKHLPRDKYKGLHNSFSFHKDDQNGYINTDLMLLQYRGFALNVIE